MLIVSGHLTVRPVDRDEYLAGCVSVVEQARRAPGCLDFAISADLLEDGRINVQERWESQSQMEAFRGSGPDDSQTATMLGASVSEYEVGESRTLS